MCTFPVRAMMTRRIIGYQPAVCHGAPQAEAAELDGKRQRTVAVDHVRSLREYLIAATVGGDRDRDRAAGMIS